MSFHTLIDRKNLPEDAYCAAWGILDDRFGNPFIVGKAYRDKIQSWHKISSKDSKDLCEFANFLTSVTTAMPYVQGLQILNDFVVASGLTG